MGIAERREREKLRRRKDILDAAEKIFFLKGFNAATMDDVAEKAELSKGTLYLYFKSKEELYYGLTERALNQLLEMFKSAVKKEKTGLAKTRAIGEAYYQYSQQYSEYFNTIVYYETAQMGNSAQDATLIKCHELGQKVMEVLEDAILTGQHDGSIRSDLDANKTAYLLQGQSNGVIQLIAREGVHIREFENFDPEELITDFMQLMLHALKSGE